MFCLPSLAMDKQKICMLQNPTWRPNLMRHAAKGFVQAQVVV